MESFEKELDLNLPRGNDFHCVFIRAPSVKSVGEGVEKLATLDDSIVAVRQGRMIGTAFHPELSGSTVLHEYLISLAKDATPKA